MKKVVAWAVHVHPSYLYHVDVHSHPIRFMTGLKYVDTLPTGFVASTFRSDQFYCLYDNFALMSSVFYNQTHVVKEIGKHQIIFSHEKNIRHFSLLKGLTLCDKPSDVLYDLIINTLGQLTLYYQEEVDGNIVTTVRRFDNVRSMDEERAEHFLSNEETAALPVPVSELESFIVQYDSVVEEVFSVSKYAYEYRKTCENILFPDNFVVFNGRKVSEDYDVYNVPSRVIALANTLDTNNYETFNELKKEVLDKADWLKKQKPKAKSKPKKKVRK